MKKGFTLVELLAVIVILAVILVISIPQVLKVVDNSRISAYLKNEQMVLKALDVYVSRNTGELPGEIGSTTEVSVNHLITNGFLTEITNPYNKNEDCTGYITITKLSDTEYDYTPHLRCGLDIHDSSDDGLVLHYKFDDFQEPTENLLPPNQRSVILGNTSGWSHGISNISWPVDSYEATTENVYVGTHSIKATTIGARVSEGIGMNGIPCEANTLYTLSMYAYLPLNKTFHLAMATTINSTVEHLGSKNITGTGNWQRIELTTNKKIENSYNLRWTLRADFLGSVVYYVDAVQLEAKPYATPFVDGIRDATVLDYSGNNNHSNLDLNNAPRWIFDDERSSGVYEFDGINNFIDAPNFSDDLNDFTFTIWVKPNDLSHHNSQVSVASFGKHAQARIVLMNSSSTRISVRWRRNDGSYTSYILSNSLNPGYWYKFVMSYDSENNTLIAYVNGKKVYNNTSVDRYSSLNYLRIGRGSSYDNMNGYLKDARIYNRVLSDLEIKKLYESTR